jgi:hypothetical protein
MGALFRIAPLDVKLVLDHAAVVAVPPVSLPVGVFGPVSDAAEGASAKREVSLELGLLDAFGPTLDHSPSAILDELLSHGCSILAANRVVEWFRIDGHASQLQRRLAVDGVTIDFESRRGSHSLSALRPGRAARERWRGGELSACNWLAKLPLKPDEIGA